MARIGEEPDRDVAAGAALPETRLLLVAEPWPDRHPPGVEPARRDGERPRARAFLRSVGPELVSGASDNDPTTVGAALAVGARTAYQLSWVALLIAPLLAVVLTIAARVGAVARSDLQTLTVRRYGVRVGAALALTIVVVNVATIAADLQAGAAGMGILAGVDARWLVLPLGLALFGLLLVGRYDAVVAVVRYVLLAFPAFGAAAVLARPNWANVLRSSVVPSLSMHDGAAVGGIALLGTTLTSYVYVWETISRGREAPARQASRPAVRRATTGAVVSSLFTALIVWFVLVASAATLGRDHATVSSLQEGARALHPLAGSLSADLFALGLVASAVVALPVLMASTAYVVGAQFGWRRGLSERAADARPFYGALAASLALGFTVTLAKVSVIAMLVAASVIGGLGAPFGLIVLVLLGRDRAVMGDGRISAGLAIAGCAVASLVGGLGLLFLIAGAFGGL